MRARIVTLALAAAFLAVSAPTAADEVAPACGHAVPLGGLPTLDDVTPMTRCVGKIQPGANVGGCTMNWVVRDADGALYVGTAGHCVWKGQRVSALGVGEFGTVVFSVNGGVGKDYALIKIDPAKYDRVDPTLCHWGGPLREPDYAGVDRPADVVDLPRWLLQDVDRADAALAAPALYHYGWGIGTNEHEATRPRVGAAAAVGANSLTLLGHYNPGDSGSPVMFADGAVAGIVTHSFLVDPPAIGTPETPAGPGVTLHDHPRAGAGVGLATRFDRALALAEAATGLELELVTSDVLPLVPVATGAVAG